MRIKWLLRKNLNLPYDELTNSDKLELHDATIKVEFSADLIQFFSGLIGAMKHLQKLKPLQVGDVGIWDGQANYDFTLKLDAGKYSLINNIEPKLSFDRIDIPQFEQEVLNALKEINKKLGTHEGMMSDGVYRLLKSMDKTNHDLN